MRKLLNRLDDTDQKTFSKLKWSLTAISGGATTAFVAVLAVA